PRPTLFPYTTLFRSPECLGVDPALSEDRRVRSAEVIWRASGDACSAAGRREVAVEVVGALPERSGLSRNLLSERSERSEDRHGAPRAGGFRARHVHDARLKVHVARRVERESLAQPEPECDRAPHDRGLYCAELGEESCHLVERQSSLARYVVAREIYRAELRGIESVRTGPPGRAHHAGERADLLEDRETPYARGAPPRDVRVYRIGGHVREAHRAHPCLGRAAEPAEHRLELLLIHLDRRVALTLRTLQLDELGTPIDQELAPRPLLRDRVARVTREEHTSLAECAGPGDRARFRALRAPGDRVCPEPDDPASPIVPPRELWI